MSKMEDEMTAFQIDERDNVATALKVLEPGTVRLLGDSREKKLQSEKRSLRDIRWH